MIRYLLAIVALVNVIIVSAAYAVNDDVYGLKSAQLAEPFVAGDSIKDASRIVKKARADLDGAYITVPRRCIVCHTFSKRANNNLISTESSDDSCDWCHSHGAGSMFSIIMDNDEFTMAESGVGHSRGYGLGSGKWKSPDDTYPAFTPKYWKGGLNCMDCHPAHDYSDQAFKHQDKRVPAYRSGAIGEILRRNPDREVNEATGREFDDTYKGNYSSSVPYPVKGTSIDWGDPKVIKPSTPTEHTNMVNRICADCHDGDAGLHNLARLVFSQEAALRGGVGFEAYVEASGHDAQLNECTEKTKFDPEDGINNGPDCRRCHSGSNDCDICHGNYQVTKDMDSEDIIAYVKRQSKNVLANVGCSSKCVSFGISYPHRTLGSKMLKDELFGIDVEGREIKVGQVREFSVQRVTIKIQPAHDLDSVCLDCHNPRVWNPKSEELFMRGMP